MDEHLLARKNVPYSAHIVVALLMVVIVMVGLVLNSATVYAFYG